MDESDDEFYDLYEIMGDEQNFDSSNKTKRSNVIHSTLVDMLTGRVNMNSNKVNYNIDSGPQMVYGAGHLARARPSTGLAKPYTSSGFIDSPVRQNKRGHSPSRHSPPRL